MTRVLALAGVLLALTSCSKTPKPTDVSGMGGGGASIAETMADAPTHSVPGTVEVKPPCNQNGYMKLDVAAGTAFTIEAASSAGCASLGLLDANGSNVGSTVDVCADAPQSLAGTGQEGATFVTVSETGACAGNSVTLNIK